MQYCVLANHCWFFGEAVYLYSVLIASVFIDNNKHLPYICLGWGEFFWYFLMLKTDLSDRLRLSPWGVSIAPVKMSPTN